MTHSASRLAAPAIAIAVLVLAPFVNKAFTIDDTVFLREAQQAILDPRHPTAFVMVWNENAERVVPTSGPLMAWLLVPAVLAGGAEWVAHGLQILMLAVAVLATVALALRTGVPPAWAAGAGLLLVATPAALGMAGTAMADVPAMALGAAGIERLVAWKQDRRSYQGALAALLLGLAGLARTHLVLVLGIGALLLAGDFWKPSSWLRTRWTVWVPVAAALMITVGVVLFTRDPVAATGLVGTTLQVSSREQLAPNIVAFLTHWVLVLPLAIPWVLLRPAAILRRWPVLVLGTALSATLLSIAGHSPVVFSLVPGLGFAVLFDILLDGWTRRDAVQLSLGVWLLVALAAVPYGHVPSKYLLASAPAAALLVARAMAARGGAVARIVLGLTLVLGIGLGTAILRADAAFAGLGRRAVADLVAPTVAAGHRVWFTPHWGFQWYAERAGGKIVTLLPPHPIPGDFLVTSDKTEQAVRVQRLLTSRYRGRARHIARVEDTQPGGRLMDHGLGVGFFSNTWGYLPWVWSNEVLDGFDLWRIE